MLEHDVWTFDRHRCRLHLTPQILELPIRSWFAAKDAPNMVDPGDGAAKLVQGATDVVPFRVADPVERSGVTFAHSIPCASHAEAFWRQVLHQCFVAVDLRPYRPRPWCLRRSISSTMTLRPRSGSSGLMSGTISCAAAGTVMTRCPRISCTAA